MDTSQIRWARLIGGAVLLLLGLLWALQGAGIVGGSVMSGQSQWLLIGAVMAVVGLWLAATGLRGSAKPEPSRRGLGTDERAAALALS